MESYTVSRMYDKLAPPTPQGEIIQNSPNNILDFLSSLLDRLISFPDIEQEDIEDRYKYD